MLIYLSLLFLFLAGTAACGVPKHLFNLETTLSSGKLQIWMMIIKAFGVPLSLLILRVTKNHLVTLASALYGLMLTFLSFIVIFDISELAPSANLYGILFVISILIFSVSLALFSMIEVSKIFKEKLSQMKEKKEPLPKEASDNIEGTYQTPTNPS
jgi:hypothetical protein